MHMLAEDSCKYHLNVFEEGVMVKVVEVDADFVREDYRIVVFYSYLLARSGVAVSLLFSHIVCNHLVFQTVFQVGIESNSRLSLIRSSESMK